MSGPAPVVDQEFFRFRVNTGTLDSSPSWLEDENVDHDQLVDVVIRVRFGVQETAGGAKNNWQPQIEYQKNSGGFLNVNGSSLNVQSASGTRTDGDDCDSNHFTSLSGTQDTANAGYDDVNGKAGGSTNDVPANGFVELEYAFQIIGADVADADTIDIRIVAMNAYTVANATLTVDKPGAAGPTILKVPTNVHLRR